MKKLSLLAIMMIIAFAAVAFAATVPEDKQFIDLKTQWKVEGAQKAVFFKHATHATALTCDKCHKSPEGGDVIAAPANIKGNNDKNGAHAFCWGCHQTQEKNPTGKTCGKCHTGKAQ